MRLVKFMSVAVVLASAMLVWLSVGSSSAALLCETTSTPCDSGYGKGAVLDASVTPGTTGILETTGKVLVDTCTGGTVKGKSSNAGGGEAEEPVTGTIETLTFSGCSRTTTVLKLGGFEIQRIAETEDGKLIGTGGTEVTINTIFGSCVFGTGTALDLGTLTGGESPTIDFNAIVPKISGNVACPGHAILTASYTLTEPKPLYVEGA